LFMVALGYLYKTPSEEIGHGDTRTWGGADSLAFLADSALLLTHERKGTREALASGSGLFGREEPYAALLYHNFQLIRLLVPLRCVERKDEPARVGIPGAVRRNTRQVRQHHQMHGARGDPLFPDRIGGAQHLRGGAALAECEHGLRRVVAETVTGLPVVAH